MKAFLSHSSSDKPFVEEVANLLGRQHYLLDRQQFDVGQDFKNEIARCLKIADTFVLFASKSALASKWVTYEMDIAEDKRINGLLTDGLVFLLGDASHTDLPSWLSKGLVIPATSPKAVAREIALVLDKRLGATRPGYFFGRGLDRERISKALHPIGQELPRVLALWGLPGIGRRTLMEEAARNFLQYKHFLSVDVESGDDLSDLVFKLAAECEFYSDVAALKKLRSIILAESEVALRTRLDGYLTRTSHRTFLSLLDVGGLVNADGDASSVCRAVLDVVAKENSLYVGMILRRLPLGLVGPHSVYFGVVAEHVKALEQDDVERLLAKLLSDRKLKFEITQIKLLATYVRGYPPAAYYAAELAMNHGLDLLLSEPRPMINFRTRVLASLLPIVEATSSSSKLLEVLAFYSPLPLGVIGECSGLTANDLASALAQFINSSIVEVDADGFYSISEPLIESAQNLFDRWQAPHAKVAKALEKYVAEFGLERGGLTVLRSLFRANKLAGLDESENDLTFPADLVRLTEEFYHQRNYEKAVEIGTHAITIRPENIDARSFLARAYAQLGHFKQAFAEAQKIRDLGSLKEYYFLCGFINKLESNLSSAIQNYSEALRRGRKGVAIHRELASCYFHEGDLANAKLHLKSAQVSSDRKNRYVLDLLVTIAVAEGDESGARTALAELEEVDRIEFFCHRSSAVEYRFGDKRKAKEFADEAIANTHRPTFAMLSQRIKCEIATEDLPEAAAHLTEAENRFGATQRDVLLGLRCKWELANDEFANASAVWQKISCKDRPVHKALRRDVVRGLLSIVIPNTPEFDLLEKELAILNNEIGTMAWDAFDEILE